MFEEIPKNCRYGYGRVSSKSQEDNSSLEAQKDEFLRLGVPGKNIRVDADKIEDRPVFYHLIDDELKENKNLSITEIAKLTGRGRTTIYKVLKEELNYIPYNRLVKATKGETNEGK
jgi:DNA invertase Pin-like site-specific DNA recombinase